MANKDFETIADEALLVIKQSFPWLNIEEYENPNVTIAWDIPTQKGLDFDIHLYLDSDILNIYASNMCCEFFPISSQKVVTFFIEAVIGLINGNYRIVNYLRNDLTYKSVLQRLQNSDWKTVSIHRSFFTLPWNKFREQIVQNKFN